MTVGKRVKQARNKAKLTQAKLAEAVGITQATISDLEKGDSRSSAYLVQIANACEVNVDWLATGIGSMTSERKALYLADDPAEPGTPSESDYALIPQLSARGENGAGYLNDHIEVTGGLAFKRAWLARQNLRPEHLSVIYAQGDSMEPYIVEGDVVLIDHNSTRPINGKPFAIRRPDDSISIKRLTQRVTGEWMLTSDNPSKARYPDEIVDAESVGSVPIIGQVVWRGGAMT